MKPRSLVPLLLVGGLLAAARPVGAQIAEGFHYDPPTASRLDEEGARAKLLTWVANADNSREQLVYFRNTSDQQIDITSYEFSQCINISGVKCAVEFEGPRIEPGETIILKTIGPRDRQQGYSYQYRFTVRFSAPAARLPTVTEPPTATPTAPPVPRTGWTRERFEYVDRVMSMLLRNHSVPGAAIVLIKDARVQWSAGYGVAYPDGPAVTPSTVFEVGSLGQPVIALTFLRLAQARGWRLEDPVSSWAFEPAIPQGFGTLSAASLLAHTGGVSYGADADGFRRAPSPQGWQYSEAGYSLLKYLVEMSEGHDLEVLVRALVTEPHSLSSMSFVPPGSDDLARGHDRAGELLPKTDGAAGAVGPLFSSASDLARFLIEVSPLSRRDPGTWRRMTHPRVAVQEDIGLSWGLGWAVGQTENGSNIVFQWNSDPGSKSLAMVDEDLGRGIVILTNGEHGLELAVDVLRMLDPRSHRFLEYMLRPVSS